MENLIDAIKLILLKRKVKKLKKLKQKIINIFGSGNMNLIEKEYCFIDDKIVEHKLKALKIYKKKITKKVDNNG